MKRLVSGILSALILLCSMSAFAVVSPTADFYVLDNADVLSAKTEEHIIAANDELYKNTGAQICVVTVDFTGSQDIDEYAYDIFNRWGIGSKEKNNGVLLLLSIGGDDYYALQGEGIERQLTSGDLKDILLNYLEDDFANKNYDDGVYKTFDSIVSRVSNIYGVPLNTSDDNAYNYDHDESTGGIFGNIFQLIITVVIVFVFIVAAVGSSKRRIYRGFGPFYTNRYRRPPTYPFGINYRNINQNRSGGFTPPRSGGGGFTRGGGAGRSGFGGDGRSGGSSFSGGGGRSGGGGSSRGGGAGRH